MTNMTNDELKIYAQAEALLLESASKIERWQEVRQHAEELARIATVLDCERRADEAGIVARP